MTRRQRRLQEAALAVALLLGAVGAGMLFVPAGWRGVASVPSEVAGGAAEEPRSGATEPQAALPANRDVPLPDVVTFGPWRRVAGREVRAGSIRTQSCPLVLARTLRNGEDELFEVGEPDSPSQVRMRVPGSIVLVVAGEAGHFAVLTCPSAMLHDGRSTVHRLFWTDRGMKALHEWRGPWNGPDSDVWCGLASFSFSPGGLYLVAYGYASDAYLLDCLTHRSTRVSSRAGWTTFRGWTTSDSRLRLIASYFTFDCYNGSTHLCTIDAESGSEKELGRMDDEADWQWLAGGTRRYRRVHQMWIEADSGNGPPLRVDPPADLNPFCEPSKMHVLNDRYVLIPAPRLGILDVETGRVFRTNLEGSDRWIQFCGESCHALEERMDGVYVAEVNLPK